MEVYFRHPSGRKIHCSDTLVSLLLLSSHPTLSFQPSLTFIIPSRVSSDLEVKLSKSHFYPRSAFDYHLTSQGRGRDHLTRISHCRHRKEKVFVLLNASWTPAKIFSRVTLGVPTLLYVRATFSSTGNSIPEGLLLDKNWQIVSPNSIDTCFRLFYN